MFISMYRQERQPFPVAHHFFAVLTRVPWEIPVACEAGAG
jgi:hypothetical protein